MAKISTYELDSLVSSTDKLIGTDANNSNLTKNFEVGDLLSFFESSLNYVPYTGATSYLDLGNNDIYANEGEFGRVDIFNRLWLSDECDISLGGDEGSVGDILTSNSTGVAPQWTSQTNFFSNAILTLPTYDSNAAALSGGLVQGQLYKSSAGVVSIVL